MKFGVTPSPQNHRLIPDPPEKPPGLSENLDLVEHLIPIRQTPLPRRGEIVVSLLPGIGSLGIGHAELPHPEGPLNAQGPTTVFYK